MKPRIYWDHNATTPFRESVRQAMEPFLRDAYGNPSSLHSLGREAACAVRQARREVALFLGAEDEKEVVFTSGGTESNQTVLGNVLAEARPGRKRLVTTAVEHSSILKWTQALREGGIEVAYVPVSSEGDFEFEQFERALDDPVVLVSVMMANNETGVLFPIEEIGRKVRERGILFHVDAVQAVGKIPISVKDLPLDFLSLSAHKFGGPKGIGALYVKKDTPFHPLFFGTQERGRRAGTENVAGIVGLAEACRLLGSPAGAPPPLQREQESRYVHNLRDAFEKQVLDRISDVQINGSPQNRLPNTSNLAFEGVDAEALLILLDEAGVCASQGSACLSGAPEPSYVLKAMGYSDERARSSVRFSFGPENTIEEVDQVVGLLERFTEHLRQIEFQEQHPHAY